MDQIKALLEGGITAQEFIEIIKIILAEIFGFIQDDQGWEDAPEA